MRRKTSYCRRCLVPLWFIVPGLLLASVVPAQEASAPAAPAARVFADFDRVRAPVTFTGEIRAADTAADGNRFVRVTAPAGGALKGQLLYTLPEG